MKISQVEVDPKAIGAEVRARLERTLADVASVRLAPRFLDRMQTLAELLALWGARTNLTARPSDPVETSFHILDSLAPVFIAARRDGTAIPEMLAEKLGKGRRVLDLGSGAGFPGLVLAAASDAHFTLSEARRKRASFLTVAVAEMGLDNAVVESARAEMGDITCDYDAMTARAIGNWPSLWKIAAAAIRLDGIAILYLARDQPLDIDLARASGFASCRRVQYEVDREGNPGLPRDDRSMRRDLIVALKR
ncbi:MAG: 16S rRNA (guanine(527)-N(7))-methyltransferase RsmG [Candidatus Binatales bacterium]